MKFRGRQNPIPLIATAKKRRASLVERLRLAAAQGKLKKFKMSPALMKKKILSGPNYAMEFAPTSELPHQPQFPITSVPSEEVQVLLFRLLHAKMFEEATFAITGHPCSAQVLDWPLIVYWNTFFQLQVDQVLDPETSSQVRIVDDVASLNWFFRRDDWHKKELKHDSSECASYPFS